MSIRVKNYREVSRSYLLKVIEKQKENVETYPVSLFNKNLEDDLKKLVFLTNIRKSFGGGKRFVQEHFVAYMLQSTMATIDEVCNRVKIINALEEPGRCSECNYCVFLTKLKTRLQELNLFTTNAHIQR